MKIIEIISEQLCESHALLGCNPLTVGGPNVAADSESTAALFNLVGGLYGSAFVNSYATAVSPSTFDKASLNRVPEHYQLAEFSTIEYANDISDTLTLNAKFSYGTRRYDHMNDNDYSYTSAPFTGVVAALGPISFEGCFGGFDNKFSFETVDSDRTYEFSTVDTFDRQAEVTLISDYDGPFNFVVGYYSRQEKNNRSSTNSCMEYDSRFH